MKYYTERFTDTDGVNKARYGLDREDGAGIQEVGVEEWSNNKLATETNDTAAFMLSMGQRVANTLRPFMGPEDGADKRRMEAMDEVHPLATGLGDVAPYLAATPAVMAAGGLAGAAGVTAAGVGLAGLLADPGETAQDMLLSGVPAAKVFGAGKLLGKGTNMLLNKGKKIAAKAEEAAQLDNIKAADNVIKMGPKPVGKTQKEVENINKLFAKATDASNKAEKAAEQLERLDKWGNRAITGGNALERTARAGALVVPGVFQND